MPCHVTPAKSLEHQYNKHQQLVLWDLQELLHEAVSWLTPRIRTRFGEKSWGTLRRPKVLDSVSCHEEAKLDKQAKSIRASGELRTAQFKSFQNISK